MERWQKIERCLAEFFRRKEFNIYQQGDMFASLQFCDDFEFNITQLAKEIDSDIGYDKNKDLGGSINEGFAAIRERVAAGGSEWEREK